MKTGSGKVAESLISFGEKLENFDRAGYFTPNRKADSLIWESPTAYLLAVIYDQGMKAERVWDIPFLLKSRLGHLDVARIAAMDDKDLIKVFRRAPTLHRFPRVMALNTKRACKLVISRYGSDAKNIWNDEPSSSALQDRFDEFAGIGQKKASMAANLLVRAFGVRVKDKRGIDISYDVHVRRVFLRARLVDTDSADVMIETARRLNPEYPGIFDSPAWTIGREYCHPSNPECGRCPISAACPKRLN